MGLLISVKVSLKILMLSFGIPLKRVVKITEGFII